MKELGQGFPPYDIYAMGDGAKGMGKGGTAEWDNMCKTNIFLSILINFAYGIR